ncbi:unnamed protein product [Dracunculus medinensis]|uniref:Protein twisted gastrulation n=1 Tax=Dracunculus medinensis TaxID=318479 RepID=A0A0N4UB08_DRAME|nr:unnamed protein product [Dracunculus medinensis]
MFYSKSAFLLVIFLALNAIQFSAAIFDCSETRCGPRVSKCMLIKACNCSITRQNILSNNCTCCNQCIQCLDKQFTECCSCFGLCNPDREIPRINSYVEKLEQNDEDLIVFDKVASINRLGTTHTFPIMQEYAYDVREGKYMNRIRDSKDEATCTVLYLDQCMSHEECSRQCLVIGATMLRWFHTGCCECIGHTCLPYGSNIPRCKYCTDFDDDSILNQSNRHEL